jgi:hypothetical protein
MNPQSLNRYSRDLADAVGALLTCVTGLRAGL